ncbi:MAG: hypothetical protein JOZ32_17230 [Bryobacterales bacterium]|nr:hypothetical protein [Bryobacterales bacterium]
MNSKLVSAFATGAVLACGIVYLAVRPVEVGKKVDAPRRSMAPKTLPLPPAEPDSLAAHLAQLPTPIQRRPVREKPSPMPPPVRYPRQTVIARNIPPPATAAELPLPLEKIQQAAPQPEQSTLPSAPAIPSPSQPAIPPPQPAIPAPSQPAPPAVSEAAPPPAAPQANPPVPIQNVSLPAANSEARVPHTVTLTAGTLLPVRIGETLSSARNQPGAAFLATLTQPLVIDGFIIAERGARVEGRVIDASQAGRADGASHLEISLVRLATADGQNIRIRTEPYVKDGAGSLGSGTGAATIGAGAAIGAVIGAIAGGGKGAAIGAGAGGAAGAGGVLLTRSKAAEILVETRVTFRVHDPVTITERLD